MGLEEYKRKRRFSETPEPEGKVAAKNQRRFVVQKHRATRLHYDFRLEMEGVLKSWAVPKGPSLDPADKRLAMHVEDHPVSYFHFEGTIPEGNYGAGTVMVWDTGKWEPVGDASAMLKKGDLKFRLHGEKLQGEFALVHMKSRRPDSKGTEWLLIKHRDEQVVPGYDIDKFDYSVLTGRSLAEIAGDEKSAQWKSSRQATSPKRRNQEWLADSIAIADKAKVDEKKKSSAKPKKPSSGKALSTSRPTNSGALTGIEGAVKSAMPRVIHPMLATLVDDPFDDDKWLFEIKWDGYRSTAFVNEKGDRSVRLVSRNQNEQTRDFPELQIIGKSIKADTAIVDGEIVALDEHGRASFSLMQQRSGFQGPDKRTKQDRRVQILYYAFDLLYLDGYSLFRVPLEKRKELLSKVLMPNDTVRLSEHFVGKGNLLMKAAAEQKLEGIVAKLRNSAYVQKRSSEWLKMKMVQRQECVIGGYTDPRGSRENFGSLVLGLYDDKDRLIPVGQAGSGFTEKSHADMWKRLAKLKTDRNPFYGKVDSTRRVHYVKPEMVAEIKFTEWTHEGQSGQVKMRAPVFLGLRTDKKPRECRFEVKKSATKEAKKAEEEGEAA
jgi:bifunctional non-homologous end joining protein LigD